MLPIFAVSDLVQKPLWNTSLQLIDKGREHVCVHALPFDMKLLLRQNNLPFEATEKIWEPQPYDAHHVAALLSRNRLERFTSAL